MRKCLDEGLIQAYADGELSPAEAGAAAAHISACAACSALLAEAEQEGAFFATAFGPDASTPVPSGVLRARVEAAVARLDAAPGSAPSRRRGFDFGALFAPLAGLLSFTPRRAAGFASVLAVVAFAVVFLAVRERTAPDNPPREIAAGVPPAPARPAPSAEPKEFEERAPEQVMTGGTPTAPRVVRATRRAVNPRRRHAPAAGAAPETPSETLVPGEHNYREAIASLEKVVKAGGDAVLAPSARIEYERSVAVLDRAIEETRRAALRNPKDRDTVGFLMAAYQSKVELLSTVADQAQVAYVGR